MRNEYYEQIRVMGAIIGNLNGEKLRFYWKNMPCPYEIDSEDELAAKKHMIYIYSEIIKGLFE